MRATFSCFKAARTASADGAGTGGADDNTTPAASSEGAVATTVVPSVDDAVGRATPS